MKTIACLLAGLLSLSLVLPASAADKQGKTKPKRGKLYHVVAFKFKPDASPEQIEQVVKAFGELKSKIKEIRSLEWGTNVSPEGLNKGFTHCWVLQFRTAEDRDAYLNHPDHKAFGKMLGPVLEDVFVVDFWASQPPAAAKAKAKTKS